MLIGRFDMFHVARIHIETPDAKRWPSTRDGGGAGNADHSGNAGDATCVSQCFPMTAAPFKYTNYRLLKAHNAGDVSQRQGISEKKHVFSNLSSS